jgi:hypothetical protein
MEKKRTQAETTESEAATRTRRRGGFSARITLQASHQNARTASGPERKKRALPNKRIPSSGLLSEASTRTPAYKSTHGK